ncbi:MAG: putative DNA binding domain-containing protein [Propionibacteriaceae bacterium]|jgi:predicted HTH transcriptional regulator|nr:putative DNA binding domain-containing protein [Propionibacteriaceae bacterium]
MGIGFEPTLTPDGKLSEYESKTLEYKRDLSSKERIIRALVAFANSAGGSLVIGVADDHSVLGVADPLLEENRLANLVANGVQPMLRPDIEVITVGGKALLIARVYPAGRRPYWVAAEGPEGVYVRLGSSTVQADQWQIAELRRQSEGVPFDLLPNLEADKGLDSQAIAAALPGREVGSAKSVLQLTVYEQGKQAPTNGGVLLFGHDRERLFPDAWVQCGRFQGPKGLDLVDQVELYAPLLELPDLVEAFLKKHAFRGANLTEWRRKDDWSVPIDILREAVINALTHSDYSQRGGPIRVAFYDDRVYVESLGGLLPGMTVEMMKGGVSRIRNQVIARVFREAGLIEQWGYGVRRMFDRAADLGLPEPTYVELPGRLRFIVPTRHADIRAGAKPERVSQLHTEVTEITEITETTEVGAKYATRILRALRDAPMPRSELLTTVGLTPQTSNARRHIAPLLEAGFIEMTEPEKPNSRSQRYQITEAGRSLLLGQ